jgi:hypothetical protein|tara:strand:- start:612 stop:1004 length:393 start_codon:yes stop_codon:yes gene_type:complete
MAITIIQNANHKSLTGKTLSIQSELTSKLKSVVVDITYAAGDGYLTGGNVVDVSLGSRISTVIGAEILDGNKGLLLQYIPSATNAASTGKIKCYGEDHTVKGAAARAFAELANASTAVNSMTCKIRVLGF